MTAPFAELAEDLGLKLDRGQVEAFRRYRDMILEAADSFNLTAVREADEIERRHFLESLALGLELERIGAVTAGPAKVIDIGSGAGIPGLPVKIAWPALQITLLESNEKRCRFLRSVIAALDLSGTRVVEGRAEMIAREPGEREAYGLALARAVAPLAVLLEYALPLLRLGGMLAAPKGSAAPREISDARGALEVLGGEIVSTGEFKPPYGRTQTLVLIRKVRETPERYPRRPGIPAKRPLA